MRRDIREGRLNLASLSEKLEKNLAEVYCVSRDTARKARDAVLVAQAMWRDIRDGRRSPASLGAMSEKELEETYGVSRHIASKERAAVLSEINEEPICDK
jgi:DNA-binding GntR family transcriptional regulator